MEWKKDIYDELIDRLLKSEEIKKLYDSFIIKDITFREWVIGHTDDLMMEIRRSIRIRHMIGDLYGETDVMLLHLVAAIDKGETDPIFLMSQREAKKTKAERNRSHG